MPFMESFENEGIHEGAGRIWAKRRDMSAVRIDAVIV